MSFFSSFQFGDNNTQAGYNPLDTTRPNTTDDFQGKVEKVLREWINLCHNNQTMSRDLQATFAQVVSYVSFRI